MNDNKLYCVPIDYVGLFGMLIGSQIFGFGIGIFNLGWLFTGLTMFVSFTVAWNQALKKVKHWEMQ